ncbi:hypothetical protein [Candidatus Harpocratesius sp.]
MAFLFELFHRFLISFEKNPDLSIFGLYQDLEIFSPKEFRKRLNWILDMFFGKKNVALLDDGKFWFTDDTFEMEEQNKALSSLVQNKMTKVIEDFDEIRKYMFEKKYHKVLEQCRTTAEDFLKDFLLNHNITSYSLDRNGIPIPVQDDILGKLCQGLRDNFDDLIILTTYFKDPTTKTGFDRFFLVIGEIIDGITNEFSHGKGTAHSLTATELDAKTTIGFLVNIINLILAYQK